MRAVVQSQFPTSGGSGLEYKDGFLWTHHAGVFNKYDPVTGQHHGTFNGPQTNAGGLAWDGTHWWVGSTTTTYKLNANFTLATSFGSQGSGYIGDFQDYAYDPERDAIWTVLGSIIDRLYLVNRYTGATLESYQIGTTPDGVCWIPGGDLGFPLTAVRFAFGNMYLMGTNGAPVDIVGNLTNFVSLACDASYPIGPAGVSLVWGLAENGVVWRMHLRHDVPGTTDWRGTTPIPVTKRRHRARVAEDKLVVTGGYNISGSPPYGGNVAALPMNDTQVLDLETRTWAAGPSLPGHRYEHASATHLGRVHVVGGLDELGNFRAEHWSYAPGDGSWETHAPLPVAAARGSLVSDGNHLYHYGGTNPTGGADFVPGTVVDFADLQLPSFFNYEVNGFSIQTASPPPGYGAYIRFPNIDSVASSFTVNGVWNSPSNVRFLWRTRANPFQPIAVYVDGVHMFESDNWWDEEDWYQSPNIPVPAGQHVVRFQMPGLQSSSANTPELAAIELGDLVETFSTTGGLSGRLHRYDAATNAWVEVAGHTARQWPAGAHWGGRLWFKGGSTNAVESYNVATGTWTTHAFSANSRPQGPPIVVTGEGVLHEICGGNDGGDVLDLTKSVPTALSEDPRVTFSWGDGDGDLQVLPDGRSVFWIVGGHPISLPGSGYGDPAAINYQPGIPQSLGLPDRLGGSAGGWVIGGQAL